MADPISDLMGQPPQRQERGILQKLMDEVSDRFNSPPSELSLIGGAGQLYRALTSAPAPFGDREGAIRQAVPLAQMAFTGGMPMAQRGAAGMAGGKLGGSSTEAAMNQLRQTAFDETQAGTKRLLGLDKPPPPRTHQQYIASKLPRNATAEDILNSDVLWAASRDLAHQKNIPMSQAYSQLASGTLGREITAQEFAHQMSEGARYGLLSPRALYD